MMCSLKNIGKHGFYLMYLWFKWGKPSSHLVKWQQLPLLITA